MSPSSTSIRRFASSSCILSRAALCSARRRSPRPSRTSFARPDATEPVNPGYFANLTKSSHSVPHVASRRLQPRLPHQNCHHRLPWVPQLLLPPTEELVLIADPRHSASKFDIQSTEFLPSAENLEEAVHHKSICGTAPGLGLELPIRGSEEIEVGQECVLHNLLPVQLRSRRLECQGCCVVQPNCILGRFGTGLQ
ncbi:hypothetical protein B0H13DRAFT_2301462 [Mycena leptocephala]|nr:hypothetical protein B0H13DRAFT_2301462 [Mycena leptocephala]